MNNMLSPRKKMLFLSSLLAIPAISFANTLYYHNDKFPIEIMKLHTVNHKASISNICYGAHGNEEGTAYLSGRYTIKGNRLEIMVPTDIYHASNGKSDKTVLRVFFEKLKDGDYLEAKPHPDPRALSGWSGASCGFLLSQDAGLHARPLLFVPGEHTESFNKLKKGADQGDADAEFNLGVHYDNGQGVPQNYAKAVYWFQKAADQGDVGAENNLGFSYRKGQGVPQNYAKAVYWVQKAADQGDAPAEYNLGVVYYKGQGIPQNSIKAIHWFQKAANQGFPAAIRALSIIEHGSTG